MWLEPKNDLNVYKEEKTVYGTQMSFETGVERPLSSLSLYGHSTQVTTTGAQLILDKEYSKEFVKSGITFKCLQDGSVTIDGTNNSSTDVFLALFNNTDDNILSNGTYYLSGNVKNSNVILQFWQGNKEPIRDSGEGAIINFVDEGQTYNVAVVVKSGITLNNVRIYPMLNKGDKPLPFEPYTGGKPSPSPEYPQPIVTSGQDGTLEVGVDGGNLLPIIEENLTSVGGMKGTINQDGSITVTGTPLKQYERVLLTKLNLPNGKYYISGGTLNPKQVIFQINALHTNGERSYWRNRSFTVDSNVKRMEVIIQYEAKDLQPVNYTIYPMLNVGDKSIPFEPYKPKQTLSLKTPNGLPGIPLSDENTDMDITPTYVDKDGKRWVCDEIDLKRGKYVQRVKKETGLVFKKATFNDKLYECVIPKWNVVRSYRPVICDHLKYNKNLINVDETGTYAYGNSIRAKFKDSQDDTTNINNLKTYTFMYILDNPVKYDLTPEEITAYKSIKIYRPTTVISSDAWMQVGYYTAYMETKTNWKSSDFFNVQDYNRIKRNLNDIRWLALTLWPEFTFEEMGEDKNYQDYSFYADEINRFEANVEHICQGTFPFQVGERQTFYDNTPFIGWKELNRLEEACRLVYSNIKSRDNGRKMLPFTLNGGVL